MKMRVKSKEYIYDLPYIEIDKTRYTVTAPIFIDNLYGKVIDVKISNSPQYMFVGEGWSWHKNWLEEVECSVKSNL